MGFSRDIVGGGIWVRIRLGNCVRMCWIVWIVREIYLYKLYVFLYMYFKICIYKSDYIINILFDGFLKSDYI